MRPLQKILTGLAVLAIAVGLGAAVAFLATRGTTPGPVAQAPAPPATSTTPNHPTPEPVAPVPHPPRVPRPAPATVPETSEPASTAPPIAAMPTNAILTNWESRLDDILASEDDDTNKVKQLLEMFPLLPEEGQAEVAEHLLNLMAGSDLTPMADMLRNPKLPDSVQEIIMSDALNWSNQTKLPLLLDIAQNPDHPKAGEAKDWLELYVGDDYGTNWSVWREKTQEFIKDNPD